MCIANCTVQGFLMHILEKELLNYEKHTDCQFLTI